MSQIDRMITVLHGLTSHGGLAQGIAESVDARRQSLERIAATKAGVDDLSDRHVAATIQEAMTTILDSGGGISEIAGELGRAYRVGLETGLAVGLESCPERPEIGTIK